MTRRDDIKAETRQIILRAARKLFRKRGVDLCTMRAVASEAGVSPGTVMLHFSSKVSLLEASISEDIQGALNEAISSMPEGGPLVERLMHIPRTMFEFYDSDRELYRALVKNTVFEPERENQLVARQLEDYLGFIAGLIEGAKALGHLRKDVDASIAAASIASLYMGVLIHFFRAETMPPGEAAEMLLAMKRQYLAGILVKERYQ